MDDMDDFKSHRDMVEFMELVKTVEQLESPPEQVPLSNKRKRKKKLTMQNDSSRTSNECAQVDDEEKPYFCVTCMNQFGESKLAYHKSKKCEPKSQKINAECRICSKSFANRYTFERHWDVFHKSIPRKEMFENGIRCRICPRFFKNCFGYQAHLIGVHQDQMEMWGLNNETLFSQMCLKCGFLASDVDHLKKHLSERNHKKQNTDVKNGSGTLVEPDPSYKFSPAAYKCQLCSRSFPSSSRYQKHWLRFHKNVDKTEMYSNVLKCHFCDRIFPSLPGYKIHLGKIHDQQIKKFSLNISEFCKHMCNKCGHMASDKLSLQKHVDDIHAYNNRKVHNNELPIRKKIACRVCPKKLYSTLTAYEKHWRLCHPLKSAHEMCDKSISCYFCPIQFISTAIYQRHLKRDHADQLSSSAILVEPPRLLCRKCGIFVKTKRAWFDHACIRYGIGSTSNQKQIKAEIPTDQKLLDNADHQPRKISEIIIDMKQKDESKLLLVRESIEDLGDRCDTTNILQPCNVYPLKPSDYVL